jgi:hypothetical protein
MISGHLLYILSYLFFFLSFLSYYLLSEMPEVETVYFTEKGVDLLKIFPEVVELQLAMNAGWGWYDLAYHRPSHLTVPRKPIRVVYTTEEEKKKLLAAQKSQKSASSYISDILVAIKNRPQEQRTFDALVEFVSDEVILAPENIRTEILEGVIHATTACIAEQVVKEDVVVEDMVIDTVVEDVVVEDMVIDDVVAEDMVIDTVDGVEDAVVKEDEEDTIEDAVVKEEEEEEEEEEEVVGEIEINNCFSRWYERLSNFIMRRGV